MKTAFLFPGQGSQYVGMGRELFDVYPVARKVFEDADAILGFSLSRLCFDGPIEELSRTKNCQPAILTASIAALEVLGVEAEAVKADYVAGLSLGEYSALVAASLFDFKRALRLVRMRGTLMEESAEKNPGGMVCLLGLSQGTVSTICEETGCEVANLNAPGQIVISGRTENLKKAQGAALARGAKRVIPLNVSGAFHSSAMDEAAEKMKKEIEAVDFHKAACPVVSNVDATEQTEGAVIKANLIKQVNSATYWEASMRYLLGKGVGRFFEIGPGVVLKGLLRKIDPSVSVVSLGKTADVQDFQTLIKTTG